MGNRAVITTSTANSVQNSNDIGVYLHWNGGPDSVNAFLLYCKLKGYRTPETDNYGWARLCQVIGNFLGGTTSIGIDRCCVLDCDNGDNGTYIIKDWKIVKRKYGRGRREGYDLLELLTQINNAQPPKERLKQDVLEKGLKEFLDPDPF